MCDAAALFQSAYLVLLLKYIIKRQQQVLVTLVFLSDAAKKIRRCLLFTTLVNGCRPCNKLVTLYAPAILPLLNW